MTILDLLQGWIRTRSRVHIRHAWAREVWDMFLKEIFRLSKSIPDAFWEVNIYSIDGEFYHSMISRHC